MRGLRLLAAATCITVGIGCGRPKAFAPRGNMAAGTLLIHFTRKVEGPVDLLVDDVRIPVQQHKKRKGTNLTITGLPAGKHRYFIASQRDAFSPDHGEFEMPKDHGIYLVNFSQNYTAVLYGKPEPLPASEGLGGVAARLER